MTQTPELAAEQSRERYNAFAVRARMHGHEMFAWEEVSWPDEGGMCKRCRRYFTINGRAQIGWPDCTGR